MTPTNHSQTFRHPLGLPAGSVRAALTLMVVAFIVYQTATKHEVGLLWSETLMIVLAHYFTSRRFVELPKEVKEDLIARGVYPHDEQPLYLPRHTIRSVIIVAFVGLAIYLFQHGRLFDRQSIAIVGTVGAYFLGLLVNAIVRWWRGDKRGAGWWEDTKAVVTLLIVGITVVIELTGLSTALPIKPEDLQNATLGLILFYFGSR